MESQSDEQQLIGVFHPYAYDCQKRAMENQTRFVHYTSAEAAFSILRNQEVWMRKSSCMNDFSEVQHGLTCIANAWKGKIGERLKRVLDEMFDDFCSEFAEFFDAWQRHLEFDTYILCVSEHLNIEDKLGRLSMWRAYGRDSGVALVLNGSAFFGTSDALKAYSSPVAYLAEEAFDQEFERVVDGIEKHRDQIKALGKGTVMAYLLNTFKFAALCTKHPGFSEEREWRIVYTPAMASSEHLKREIQIVSGIMQPIHKLPLKNIPDEGLVGIEIPEILERVIIGPTEYGTTIREAFADMLEHAGIQNPLERIYVSSIPLR